MKNNNNQPLIAHIIYRLDVGGLENGLVNLINHMPDSRYRHAIICLTEFTDFRYRIKKSDVNVYALHKKSGNDLGMHVRLWHLLRKLKPSIVHTRNIGTLECAFTAKLAGVPKTILERSKEILEELESTFQKEATGEHLARHKTKEPDKDTLFVKKHKRVLEPLASPDVNNLTPIAAINLLNEIKNEINEK